LCKKVVEAGIMPLQVRARRSPSAHHYPLLSLARPQALG
jgi:hypothetical protein